MSERPWAAIAPAAAGTAAQKECYGAAVALRGGPLSEIGTMMELGDMLVRPTAADLRAVEAIWHGRPDPVLDRATLHGLVLARAALNPHLPAVRCAGTALTYGELAERATEVAGRLSAGGIGPGSVVAVYAAPSVERVVALLGVLVAGAAALPLDPAYPPERIRQLVADSRARPVLHDGSADLADVDLWPIRTAPGRTVPELAAGREPAVEPADRPAYLIYTSGSTGRPKGVLCHHRGAVNLLADFLARRPVPLGARCTVWTSPSFDVSVYETFSALLGGTLVIVPDEVRTDPGALLDLLHTERVASAYLPPFVLPDLADRLRARRLPQLARLLVGVEPIPESLLVTIARLVPGLHIINGYGPTESHVCATAFSIDADTPLDPADPHRRTPIGRPLRGMSAYVLDEAGVPVADGATGELYLGGTGVAFGYLNRPATTAGAFLPDRFAARPGARMYRTGDRVTRRPDGALVFQGRVDDQVKVNGFRVEPGEVEAALAALPEVTQAAVTVRAVPGGNRLEGFVTVHGPGAPPTDLRDRLATRLPAHLVPGAVHTVAEFPRTPNGKIDRAACLDLVPAQPGRAVVGARSEMEAHVLKLAGEVLGTTALGVHDGFVEAGGTSLAAMRLATRIRDATGRGATMTDILQAPTYAALAGLLESRADRRLRPADRRERPAARSPRAAPDAERPLSFGQQGIWLADRINPGSADYNLAEAYRLTGELDAGALRAALADTIDRHAALRTTFGQRDGVPFQSVAPATHVPFAVLPVSGADEAGLVATRESLRPFDLASGPPLRMTLLRAGPADHVLLLTVHHIVADDWSVEVFWRDLGACYRARTGGAAADLGPAPTAYAEYAVRQRERLRGPRRAEHLGYWREKLDGAPLVLELPADRPRTPLHGTGEDAVVTWTLPPGTTSAVRALTRRAGATAFMTLLAVFAATVHRVAGTDDFLIGTFAGNRAEADLEHVVGLFANALPLRMRCGGDPPFAELLRRVRDTALGAYDHQELPFEALVSALRPPRDLTRNPIVQVGFQVLGPRGDRLSLPGLRCEPVLAGQRGITFDVMTVLREEGDRFAGELRYRPDLFEPATARALADGFTRVADVAAGAPGTPLSSLPRPEFTAG